MATILTSPWFWLLFAAQAGFLFWLARRRGLRWRPAWALRAVLVGLVLATLFSQGGQAARVELPSRQVLVVDQSDSVAPDARLEMQQRAAAWQAAGDNRMIVAYGGEARSVLRAGQAWPALDGRASDLDTALQLAGDLLGSAPGQVVLASDGRVLQPGLIDAAVQRLRQQGHRLDVLPLAARPVENDGYVGPLSAPANLWEGTPFDIVLPVYPPKDGQVALSLKVNGQPSPATAEALENNSYKFRVPALPQGIATLEVSADFGSSAGPDPFPANNAAYATLQVFAAPRVLFITTQPETDAAGAFQQMLRSRNLQVDAQGPETLPTDLKSLGNYRVIFLHDLLASQLSHDQMLALQVFVSRLGGGVVFLGGRSSYTLGGYKDTPLETMLPVKLEPPKRAQRPPIVFVLILDRSSSMGVPFTNNSPIPMDLAREAAMRAIETLKPEDYLGVETFTEMYTWDVPLQALGSGLSLSQALDAVSRVQANGSTRLFQAFQEAMARLKELPADAPASRHVLVLSDGQSFDGTPDEFKSLAADAHQNGITVSTIALGEGADTEVMGAIAEAGKGRYYQVMQAEDLPRIMVRESQAARSENVQAGETGLKLGEPNHPILSGMSLEQLPQLSGYNALTSKADSGAEDVLVSSSFDDPLLSAWQYGLGRVVAWTGDAGEEWTGAWSSAENEAMFWSQVVRYALPSPALGPAQVSVQVQDTQLALDAALYNAQGAPVNMIPVTFTYAEPNGQVHSYNVPQQSAGIYHVEIPRPAEGAYRALVSYRGEDGQKVEVPAPFAVDAPAEWLPEDPQVGARNLEAWARLAGGQILSAQQALPGDRPPVDRLADLLAGPWWKLLAAVVVFWPLEIALRRRWLPWV